MGPISHLHTTGGGLGIKVDLVMVAGAEHCSMLPYTLLCTRH